jgi:hypothetical protein
LPWLRKREVEWVEAVLPVASPPEKDSLPIALLSLSSPNARVGYRFNNLFGLIDAIEVDIPNSGEIGVRVRDSSVTGK